MLIKLSKLKTSYLRPLIGYRFTQPSQNSKDYLKRIQQLLAQKKYQQILQVKNRKRISKDELKQKYYNLIKKYHTDKCQDDQQRAKIYEQITKTIIGAYQAIDKDLYQNRKESPYKPEDTHVEDEVCMELFNKKYYDVKYWLFQKGNQKHKNAFFDRLFLKTGQKQYQKNYYTSSSYDKTKRDYEFEQALKKNKNTNQTNKQNNDSGVDGKTVGLSIVGVIAVLGLFWIGSKKSGGYLQPPKQTSREKQTSKFTPQKIKQIELRDQKIRQQKRQKMINLIRKDHPRSLKFPQAPQQQPHIMKQLTEYSIAPDIRLYQVSPQCFTIDKQNIIKNGFKLGNKNSFRLSRIQPNTTMTLSLEAQRALQNVYVRVKDVISEIKNKGKFVPPQIFIIFHGYVMFQIREKPITLNNYKDTDYISLFDLFFQYYSPIWMKKDRFCQYLVGKDEVQYFGWVHLNHRKCDPVYLKPGEKAAFFHCQRQTQSQEMYLKIWNSYYFLNQDKWKEDKNRKRTPII